MFCGFFSYPRLSFFSEQPPTYYGSKHTGISVYAVITTATVKYRGINRWFIFHPKSHFSDLSSYIVNNLFFYWKATHQLPSDIIAAVGASSGYAKKNNWATIIELLIFHSFVLCIRHFSNVLFFFFYNIIWYRYCHCFHAHDVNKRPR